VLVVGGKYVPIGRHEVAVVFLLQLHPIFERTGIVAKVKAAGGTVSAEDDLFFPGHRVVS
jgi:hypothetical protein